MASFSIRPAAKEDDARLASVIRTVLTSFGACGAGFAIKDPEVDFISQAYGRPRHTYFVVLLDGQVMGGGGMGPLVGGAADTCELRKMYFLPEARGLGAGQSVLDACLGAAQDAGFSRCYLETLGRMTQARRLYEKNGFKPLDKPLGSTGHFSCDAWYLKDPILP